MLIYAGKGQVIVVAVRNRAIETRVLDLTRQQQNLQAFSNRCQVNGDGERLCGVQNNGYDALSVQNNVMMG
jgi:hypothetical protein